MQFVCQSSTFIRAPRVKSQCHEVTLKCKRLHKIMQALTFLGNQSGEAALFLVLSVGLFAVFAANVALGASGSTQYLGDVGEMLVLFAASIAFVIATLKREANEKSEK